MRLGEAGAVDRQARLFITVGAAHYQFNRLFRWTDSWLASDRGRGVRCFAQHGPSVPPSRAENQPYMQYADVLHALGEADVVICHGGPGSIMLARQHGLRPIVVPRLRHLGECVDDHQIAFARRMSSLGDVELAESEEELHDLLDAIAEDRLDIHVDAARHEEGPAIRRFELLIGELLNCRKVHLGSP